MVDDFFKEEEEFTAPKVKEKSGGNTTTIILVVAIAMLMGVGGFFAGKILSGGGSGGGEPAPVVREKPTGGDAQLPPHLQTGGATTAPAGKPARGNRGILALETFTVNLNDPFGRRYVECDLKLVVDDKAQVPRIRSNELLMPKIRHEIFMTISAKTYAELKDTAGKVTLFEEVRMRVNEILKEELGVEPVIEVLQTKFLMQ